MVESYLLSDLIIDFGVIYDVLKDIDFAGGMKYLI
jgi:hypothetical protein